MELLHREFVLKTQKGIINSYKGNSASNLCTPRESLTPNCQLMLNSGLCYAGLINPHFIAWMMNLEDLQVRPVFSDWSIPKSVVLSNSKYEHFRTNVHLMRTHKINLNC